LVLSSDFKLPDESQVLLIVPRENNMYNINLQNIVPSGDLTCLFAKATIDESNLWHRRLADRNFKTINKLVKGNLVRGLPIKVFENENTCVACKKGKQHKASCKTKPVSFVDQPLFRLHMDLFGPTFVKTLNKKSYYLVVTDDYSRFTWVFFLATKDETSPIFKTFITGLEDQLSLKHDFDVKKPEFEVILSPSSSAQSRKQDDKTKKEAKGKSLVESFTEYRDLSIEFQDFSENSSNEVNAASTIVPTVGQNSLNKTNPFSAAGPSNTTASPTHGKSSFKDASQEPDMPELEDITYSDDENVVGAEADFNNLETSITVSPIPTTKFTKIILRNPRGYIKLSNIQVGLKLCKKSFFNSRCRKNKRGERGIVVKNKARLIAQGHKQEEGINYEEVFSLVARIEAIRLFLAYASFMGSMVYQMDVKSAFLYGTIKKEVYVCQPLGFEDPDHPDKVYKVAKALYGLHQAPRAWLQALVDKKKVMVTEVAIREALWLDDVEGVDCLPNEEIFIELARMGYEKPSTKLTFYKAFFSNQWKFLIHTILLSMSAKRTSWNEFSSAMASAVICLSTGRKFSFSKYIFDSLVRNVDSTSKFYMYPRFLQLLIRKQVGNLSTHTTKYALPTLTQKVFAKMRRVGKGFSGVETPLFEGMLVGQEIGERGDEEEHVEDVTAGNAAQGDDTTAHEEVPTAQPQPQPQPQAVDFPMSLLQEALDACATLTRRRIDTSDDTMMDDESNQGRIIDEIDKDDAVALMDDKKEDKKDEEAKEGEPAEVQEVVDVVTTAKLITKVVTAVSKIVTAASEIISTVEPQVPAAIITIIPVKVIAAPSRKRKRVNVAGFMLDYFKGMSYDDIRPIFEAKFNSNIEFLLKIKEQMEEEENRALQSINETLAQKAAKRRKLNEEVEDLKRHLEIMPDEDDDVYTKATPLARKVLIVDYKIIELNNKPYYKIIRADGTHQLYISFPTLLKNFDREDLEALRSLVKERFSTSMPKNFSDDFLLTTLGAMFEKPDGHAQV
nr:ribonuclease H-like domain-containing protein [Tanacetum cinerariifolium]